MAEPGDQKGHPERWVAVVAILAVCGAAIWITTGFERMPPILKRGIQPSDFPQLIAGLIVVLSILMLRFDPVRVSERIGGKTWASLALMALFGVLTLVDFFLALGVFAAALAALWGERRRMILAVVGLGVPLFVFFLFDQAFAIRFPRGLLTSLWYG